MLLLLNGRVYSQDSTGSYPLIEDIQISGNTEFPTGLLLELLPFSTGSTFSRTLVLEGRYWLSNYYADHGFKYIKVKTEIYPNESTRNYQVNYNIREGIKTYIGNIHIEGNTKTKEKVIQRELLFHDGDLYQRKNIFDSQSRLLALNYFEEVRINEFYDVYPEEALDTVNFVIQLKEQKTGYISLGAGYSTQEGIRGYGRYRQSNFFGNGQQFSAGIKWAELGEAYQRSREVLLSFYEPHFIESDFALGLDGYYRREDLDNYNLRRLGGDIYLTRKIIDNYTHAKLNYRVELDRTFDITNTIDSTIIALDGKSDTITELSLNLTRDSRDNILNPSSGSIYSADLGIVSQALGGDLNFAKLKLDGRWYFPLKNPKWVLGFRVGFNLEDSYGGTDEIPIYERLYLGGADSVRGFKERYLGPKDLDGYPIGGEASVLYNIELRFPIYKSIHGVAFYDAGNVWESINDLDPLDIENSVGLGLRYQTPIGPLRVDYGLKLPQDDNGRFHISVGQAF